MQSVKRRLDSRIQRDQAELARVLRELAKTERGEISPAGSVRVWPPPGKLPSELAGRAGP